MLALRRLLEGGANLVANLGTGRGYSVWEVIEAVENVVGLPVKVREARRRSGDPTVLVAAPGCAAKELEWVPEHLRLRDQVLRHAARSYHTQETHMRAEDPLTREEVLVHG